MRSIALALLAALAWIAASGCGPSLRRVHRGELYFERCYAADLDSSVPIEERRACWQGWMRHWQSVAPPERIDYVRERLLRLDPERAAIVALATGGADADPVPLTETDPAIAAEAQAVAAASSVTPEEAANGPRASDPPPFEAAAAEPAPNGAGAPSESVREIEAPPEAPRTIPPARTRRAQRAAVMPVVDPPHCAEACRPAWEACSARCEGFDRAACHRACRIDLRTCARACY